MYEGSTAIGSSVNGTGSPLDFGAQTLPGAYSVYAINNTTACAANMTGSVTVVMNTTVHPSATIVSADTVCAGTNVSFTALTSGGGTSPVYDWSVNGLSVSVTNSYNYVPTNGDLVTLSLTSSEVCAVPATVSMTKTMVVNTNVMLQ